MAESDGRRVSASQIVAVLCFGPVLIYLLVQLVQAIRVLSREEE